MPLDALPDHLSLLSLDVLCEISTYLGLEDFQALSCTSRHFHLICQAEPFWKVFFKRYYAREYGGDLFLRSFADFRSTCHFLYILNTQEKEIRRLKSICFNHGKIPYDRIGLNDIRDKYNFLNQSDTIKNKFTWLRGRSQELEAVNVRSYRELRTSVYLHFEKDVVYYSVFMKNVFSRFPMDLLQNWNDPGCRIKSLFLCCNQLRTIPDALFTVPGLKRLVLTGNAIRYLPPAVAKATALTALSIGNNRLTSLPAELFSLTNLKYLKLGNELSNSKMPHRNKLTDLPAAVGQLTGLLGLDLRNLELPVLPESLTRLEHLHYFAQIGNKLSVNGLPSQTILNNLLTCDHCQKGFTFLNELDRKADEKQKHKRSCLIS